MKRALIGAGGFASEVKASMPDGKWMACFVDDIYWKDGSPFVFPLSKFDPEECEVMVVIGDPTDRKNVISRLPENTKFFSFIHPTAQIMDSSTVIIGEGSYIGPNCIITVNTNIGKHCHLNLATTIGHDCRIGNYFTTAPGAKISGDCHIGDCVYVGTNASIREKLNICDHVTIGLNAGVVRDITDSGIYGGVPTKRLTKYMEKMNEN